MPCLCNHFGSSGLELLDLHCLDCPDQPVVDGPCLIQWITKELVYVYSFSVPLLTATGNIILKLDNIEENLTEGNNCEFNGSS